MGTGSTEAGTRGKRYSKEQRTTWETGNTVRGCVRRREDEGERADRAGGRSGETGWLSRPESFLYAEYTDSVDDLGKEAMRTAKGKKAKQQNNQSIKIPKHGTSDDQTTEKARDKN